MHSELPSFGALHNLAITRISGPDSRKFLQGQVTCDVNLVESTRWLHGAHCTAKGRVIANFDLLLDNNDDLLLICDRSVQPKLVQSLSRYAIFSKAEVTIDEHYSLFGTLKTEETSPLHQRNLDATLPASRGEASRSDGHIVYKRTEEHWIIIAETNKEAADENFSNRWKLRELALGFLWVNEKNTEDFLPQTINLDAPTIEGVSFTKGCYTGQEVIARLHYKGNVKRQARRFSGHLIPESAVTPQTALQSESDAEFGEVIDTAHWQNQLEVIALTTEQEAEITNPTYGGQTLKHHPYSYAITSE